MNDTTTPTPDPHHLPPGELTVFPSGPYSGPHFDPTPTGYGPPGVTGTPVPGPPPVGGTPPDWLAWLSRVLIFLGVVYAGFFRPDAKPVDVAPLEAAVKRLEAGRVPQR